MGKEKIEEKDVRLLRYAVEQAFDGAMRDGALALLNRLVDSASEAANLEEELLNLKGEYQRSMENSKRGAFKRLDAAYKRKCRREKRMAKGQMLCADGKPVMFGETLYGGDGRDWLIVGIAGAWSYDVYGLHVAHDGKKEKKPLRAEWLVHELTDAGEGACRVVPCVQPPLLSRPQGSGIRQEEPERAEDCAWGVYRCGRQVYRPRIGKGRASGRVPFFRAGYAGCMECTVHLLAGMPVCYIYRQQGGRQPSRPMAEGTSR